MKTETFELTDRVRNTLTVRHSLQHRADDMLVAAAVLGLAGTVADSEPHKREIQVFYNMLRGRYALSKPHASRIMRAALRRIRSGDQAEEIRRACDILRQHLNTQQKLEFFDIIALVLIADGKIYEGEEVYLAFIASELNLAAALRQRYPELDEEECEGQARLHDT